MKKIVLGLFALLMAVPSVRADEGMWLLPYIEKLNIRSMQDRGLKLSASEIYDVNQACLKDAILQFGRGCTGEVISDQGLVLTNHHCGFSAIQGLSSVEHDYLKNGFWAERLQDELPAPGLYVTFVRQIADVTAEVMAGLNDKMSEKERAEKIAAVSEKIAARYTDKKKGLVGKVQSMFGGNQYIMYQNQRFDDVRLVGTPPQSIGKFGGETDNWMWPRHTGDFSMFRIYATADGKSAEYSAKNTPYKPVQSLKVSLKGYNEGDYAMILGFPGRTSRYMTSWEIDQVLNQDNPIRIFLRGERQKLMWQDMLSSDKIRLQYADKYANSSNYWKNSIGVSRGVRKLNVRDQKVAGQQAFLDWVAADTARQAKYGEGLPLIERSVAGRMPYMRDMQLIGESSMECIKLAGQIMEAISDSTVKDKAKVENLRKLGAEFFKNYNTATDYKIGKRMLQIYIDSTASDHRPTVFANINTHAAADAYVDQLFEKSIFVSEDRFFKALESGNITTIKKLMGEDPAMVAALSTKVRYDNLAESLAPYIEMFERGHRIYLAGLLEMNQGVKSLSPDANLTLRMTYGNILPYSPADAVTYGYYTTLSGVMAKEDPTNPEFVVPAKLKELYLAKDFGPYAYNGDVPTAFIANTDITGGNSGSGMLNDKGELIGLAFDGNWDAMSGDIAFEPVLQRTIGMDIRYVLFIVDKFAGAERLINEMNIVR